MQPDLPHILQKVLFDLVGSESVEEGQYQPVGGGSINTSFQIGTRRRQQWFCKFNNAREFPHLFVKEASGISLIGGQGLIRVPAVITCRQVEDTQVLVLEWIQEGLRSDGFWRRFGKQLARLHRVTRPEFGLDDDNYMGALPQDNTPAADWVDFFIQRRLEPQIRLAADAGLIGSSVLGHFQRLYPRLPDFFPPEPPAGFLRSL